MSTVTTQPRKKNLRLVPPIEPTIPRVVFYQRVSSDEQEERGTIASQRGYLHERYRPDFRDDAPPGVRMTYVGEYADDGWSGVLPLRDRPAGKRMLEDAAAGKFDVVVVYKVDRLGRRARVLLEAHDSLEAHGVAITSATEPFDTRPGPQQAIGVFVFQLLGSIAELERSTIQMRTMDGKHRVAREGRFVNGCVPFGFDVDEHEHLVPSQRVMPQVGMTESDLVRDIFLRVSTGQSCYAVADWLTRAGVPSLRRMYNKQHRRLTEAGNTSLIWSNRRVWETIRNPVYKGQRSLNFGQRSEDQTVQGLVDSVVWDIANQRMKTASRWNGQHDDYVYLLSKKLKCSGTLPDGQPCGYIYTGGLANHVRYYTCNGNDKANALRRGGRCGVGGIRTDVVEPLIWNDLTWALRHPEEVLTRLQDELRAHQGENSGLQQRIDDLRKERNNLELARSYLRQSLRNPRRPLAEIEEDLAANAQTIAALDESLANLETHLEVDQALESRLATTAQVMQRTAGDLDRIEQTNDRVAMRRLIDMLVDEVIVEGSGKETQYRVRYSFTLPSGDERPLIGGTQDDLTSRIRSATNIQTLVVGSTQSPMDRHRELSW